MLSIHYISIMMRIFYIDWQQHWECDRTRNIGANAYGERTVSTKQPQVTDFTTSVDSWASVTSERYWASFQVTRLFHKVTISQCDHFFAVTYICICCLKLHQADYKIEEFFIFIFLTSIWWGSTQLQCIYYLHRMLISRPPRVFRRFKRRSCYVLLLVMGW